MTVATVDDYFLTCTPYAVNQFLAARKDPAIQNVILASSGETRLTRLQTHNVQKGPRCEPCRRSECLRPPCERPIIQSSAGRFAGAGRQNIAAAMRKALGILEQTELFRGVDADIGIRADTDSPGLLQERLRREDTISQVGLSDGAQPHHGSTRRDSLRFGIGKMRGVDQAPTLVHSSVLEQPLHRPTSAPGDAVIDFLRLLGDVNVDDAAT